MPGLGPSAALNLYEVPLAESKYSAVAATLREAVELTYSVEVASDRSV